MKQVRVEAGLKNNILWHAIYDVWPSITEFCRQKNLNQQRVGALLNLRISPFCIYGYTVSAKKCADALIMDPAELFPTQLYQRLKKNRIVREYSFAELPEMEKRLQLMPASDDPFSEAVSRELSRTLNDCLATLNPREDHVVRELFGIGRAQKSSEEIGAELNVSHARVSQIARNALLKLGTAPRTWNEERRVNLYYGAQRRRNAKLREYL